MKTEGTLVVKLYLPKRKVDSKKVRLKDATITVHDQEGPFKEHTIPLTELNAGKPNRIQSSLCDLMGQIIVSLDNVGYELEEFSDKEYWEAIEWIADHRRNSLS